MRGLRWLNIMLKAWEVDGVMAWTHTEGTFALVQSDADYVFGSGGSFTTVPVDIQDMRITRGAGTISRCSAWSAYFGMPNKTTEGYPAQWSYDRQRDSGTLYLWPTPDSTAGTLKFTHRRRIMDLDALTDCIDLQQEWIAALVYASRCPAMAG